MRVVIGEDEALLREGLSLVLANGGFEIAGTADDAQTLIAHARRLVPDLVITDIRMPPDHTDEGLRAALEIRRAMPSIPIVVLSQHLQRQVAVQLVVGHSGGVGYLLKQRIADTAAFCADLRRVQAGGVVLDPEVVSLIAARARTGHEGLRQLTARQQEVLVLMAQGRSNISIARSLSLTERSVIQHVSNIYTQLGLPPSDDDHRRVLAVVRYLAQLTRLIARRPRPRLAVRDWDWDQWNANSPPGRTSRPTWVNTARVTLSGNMCRRVAAVAFVFAHCSVFA